MAAQRDQAASRGLRATSYLDWAQHTLTPIPKGTKPDGEQGRAWSDAVDAAMASASHPAAFAPEPLERKRETLQGHDRSRPVAGAGRRQGRPRRGADVRLWYTDGGLVDNQPLGRCLKLVDEPTAIDRPERHRPIRPSRSEAAGPADPLGRRSAAGVHRSAPGRADATALDRDPARALGLLAAHNVGEDLRHLEKVNTRIERSAKLADALAALVRTTPMRPMTIKDGSRRLGDVPREAYDERPQGPASPPARRRVRTRGANAARAARPPQGRPLRGIGTAQQAARGRRPSSSPIPISRRSAGTGSCASAASSTGAAASTTSRSGTGAWSTGWRRTSGDPLR